MLLASNILTASNDDVKHNDGSAIYRREFGLVEFLAIESGKRINLRMRLQIHGAQKASVDDFRFASPRFR